MTKTVLLPEQAICITKGLAFLAIYNAIFHYHIPVWDFEFWSL
jgi:hypothetical protein